MMQVMGMNVPNIEVKAWRQSCERDGSSACMLQGRQPGVNSAHVSSQHEALNIANMCQAQGNGTELKVMSLRLRRVY